MRGGSATYQAWNTHSLPRSTTLRSVKNRGKSARMLGRKHFQRTACEAPLLKWVETATVREKAKSPLIDRATLQADLGQRQSEVKHQQDLLQVAQAEVESKREEVAGLNGQIQRLTSISERLARAVDEVTGFRRETVQVLGVQQEAQARDIQSLTQELETLRVDLTKKHAEVTYSREERNRLNLALEQAQAELQEVDAQRNAALLNEGELRGSLERERGSLRQLRQEHERLYQQHQDLKTELHNAQEDLKGKIHDLAEANGSLNRLQDKEGNARSEVEGLRYKVGQLHAEISRLNQRWWRR